jgi:NAD(P)-dependent dehydrogenase (short-subunit alcohol dehydrogenase family)
MDTKQSRCALVTGASSGIGEAIALRLASDGFRVFGASRKPLDSPATNVEPLVLDVTSDDSVRTAIHLVIEKAGRLDVVVNNAGATLVGALEETSTDEARWLIETNFLGVHRVTRAALPHLRASKGHAVIIGSVAGFLAKPAEGFYSATKHALEAYAEVLRLEVAPFGVRVALVEPGFVRTKIVSKAHLVGAPLAVYEQLRRVIWESLVRDIDKGVDVTDVAECVSRIVASDLPKLRHLVGREAFRLRRIKSLMPDKMFEWGLRRRFGLAGAAAGGRTLR